MPLSTSLLWKRSKRIGFARSHFCDVEVSLDPIARAHHQVTRLVQPALALDQREPRHPSFGFEQLTTRPQDLILRRRVGGLLGFGYARPGL